MIVAHQLPQMKAVFWSQLKLMVSLRKKAFYIGLSLVLLQVVVLALFGVIFGVTISTGEEETTTGIAHISKFQEVGYPFDEGISAVLFGFAFLTIFGLFFPFKVWRSESPSRRGYHWSMPVDQRLHDTLRFTAGALFLVLLGAALYPTAIILAVVSGHATGLAELSAWAWISLLIAPLIPYTFTSIFTIRAEHPTSWLWCTIALGALVCTFSTIMDVLVVTEPLKFIGAHRYGPIAALLGIPVGEVVGVVGQTGPQWVTSWALWLLVFAGIVVWVSGHRPKST